MDGLIFTSADAEMQPFLVEWITSLRTLGRYQGDVLVLDYGLSEGVKRLLAKFGVHVHPCAMDGPIVTARFVDVVPLLEGRFADRVVAHFDADVWFQDDIGALLAMGERCAGVVCAPDVTWYRQPYHGQDPRGRGAYEAKIAALVERHRGTVQGGMQCGRAPVLAQRYRGLGALLASGFIKDQYGADQFALNHLFDPAVDSLDGYLFDGIGSDTTFSAGVWWSNKYRDRLGVLEKLKVLHVVGMTRGERRRLFRVVHAATLEQGLAGAGVPRFTPTACRERWEGDDASTVRGRLVGAIRTCRLARGGSLAIGAVPAAHVLDDIGCVRLVPLHHGHDHYWDLVELPRQRHIAEPQSLYLSAHAVEVLAGLSEDAVEHLCSRFDAHFFDLLLSILCVRAGLGYGPVLPAE
jgi:hypothetical protein